MSNWATAINAVLATLVSTIGAWLIWGPIPIGWSLAIACGILLFFLWRGTTIGMVWAWSTLLLGMESLAWPVTTMIQIRASSSQPSDEEMGIILNAVLFGLFSSVFWISFAFGLFRREQPAEKPSSQDSRSPPSRHKSSRRTRPRS